MLQCKYLLAMKNDCWMASRRAAVSTRSLTLATSFRLHFFCDLLPDPCLLSITSYLYKYFYVLNFHVLHYHSYTNVFDAWYYRCLLDTWQAKYWFNIHCIINVECRVYTLVRSTHYQRTHAHAQALSLSRPRTRGRDLVLLNINIWIFKHRPTYITCVRVCLSV